MNMREGWRAVRVRPQRSSLTLLLGVSLFACANGQDATEVLRRTAETYQTLDAYRIEGAVTVETEAAAGAQAFEMTVLMAERPDGYLRAEVHGPTMQIVVVTNVDGAWMYMPSENRYTHTENRDRTQLEFFSQDLLGEYERLAEGVQSAAILGDDRIQVGGVDRDALVVEVVYASTAAGTADSTRKMLWIDAEKHLVLRDETRAYLSETPFGEPMQIKETTTFTRIETDAPPAAFFAFQPPENAEFVDPSEMQPAGPAISAGRPAPPFVLPTLDGAELALAELEGEVVLVNFWATWCGPCRMEMPELEELYRSHAGKGLRVVAVNLGESAEIIRPYVESMRLTFPILLDASYEIGDLYQAHSLPTTVVVDRQGRVSSFLLGAHPAEAFLEAAQEAGL